MNRGKLVAALIVIAGIGAGTWAIFARHDQMRRVLEAWTPPTAEMIAHAPQVELLQLVPDTSTAGQQAELMGIGNKVYQVAQRKSVVEANGFTYLRTALVNDASYDWEHPPEGAERNWQYILDFGDGPSHFLFAFDFTAPCMMKLEGGKTVSIRPIATGAEAFCREQLPPR